LMLLMVSCLLLSNLAEGRRWCKIASKCELLGC
jgi:hypothetical protein